MQRSWFPILIVCAVFGLTGLTIVQILWLKNAIAVKEQRFDNSVRESLYEISNSIQEFEYQPFVRDLIAKNTQTITDPDDPDAAFQSKIYRNAAGQQQLYVHIEDQLDTTINIGSSEAFSNWDPATSAGQSPTVSTFSMNFDIGELPVSVMVDPYEFANKFLAQKRAVNELILKQMFSLQPITEVLDTALLQNIIQETLETKGVETEFEFGITEYTPNNFVFASHNASLKQLYSSDYVVDLFPRSVFESTKQLMLTFPRQRQYLMRALWIPLVSSTLFLILVIMSFMLALYVILRQKHVSAMKTEFINNMTHELKTPISTISLASQMLRDDSIASNKDSRLKYAGVIFDENKRLGNQVEKVLQMAKMEKGEIKYNLTPINMHDVIHLVTEQFSIQVEDIDGHMISRLDAGDPIVVADELHMTNIMNNLLDNALKYNDKDEPRIEVKTYNSMHMLVIEVRDNGMGMRKEELKRIFDKFYRVNKGDVHDTKGFGIGLSYVRTIVEAHKGTIDVRSQLDDGTVFTIRIPLK